MPNIAALSKYVVESLSQQMGTTPPEMVFSEVADQFAVASLRTGDPVDFTIGGKTLFNGQVSKVGYDLRSQSIKYTAVSKAKLKTSRYRHPANQDHQWINTGSTLASVTGTTATAPKIPDALGEMAAAFGTLEYADGSDLLPAGAATTANTDPLTYLESVTKPHGLSFAMLPVDATSFKTKVFSRKGASASGFPASRILEASLEIDASNATSGSVQYDTAGDFELHLQTVGVADVLPEATPCYDYWEYRSGPSHWKPNSDGWSAVGATVEWHFYKSDETTTSSGGTATYEWAIVRAICGNGGALGSTRNTTVECDCSALVTGDGTTAPSCGIIEFYIKKGTNDIAPACAGDPAMSGDNTDWQPFSEVGLTAMLACTPHRSLVEQGGPTKGVLKGRKPFVIDIPNTGAICEGLIPPEIADCNPAFVPPTTTPAAPDPTGGVIPNGPPVSSGWEGGSPASRKAGKMQKEGKYGYITGQPFPGAKAELFVVPFDEAGKPITDQANYADTGTISYAIGQEGIFFIDDEDVIVAAAKAMRKACLGAEDLLRIWWMSGKPSSVSKAPCAPDAGVGTGLEGDVTGQASSRFKFKFGSCEVFHGPDTTPADCSPLGSVSVTGRVTIVVPFASGAPSFSLEIGQRISFAGVLPGDFATASGVINFLEFSGIQNGVIVVGFGPFPPPEATATGGSGSAGGEEGASENPYQSAKSAYSASLQNGAAAAKLHKIGGGRPSPGRYADPIQKKDPMVSVYGKNESLPAGFVSSQSTSQGLPRNVTIGAAGAAVPVPSSVTAFNNALAPYRASNPYAGKSSSAPASTPTGRGFLGFQGGGRPRPSGFINFR